MTIISPDDKRLKFMPIEEAIVPPGGIIEHLKDRYWMVHPERGLVFWVLNKREAPQCNTSPLIGKIYKDMYPWAEVRFMPSVFRSIRLTDYID